MKKYKSFDLIYFTVNLIGFLIVTILGFIPATDTISFSYISDPTKTIGTISVNSNFLDNHLNFVCLGLMACTVVLTVIWFFINKEKVEINLQKAILICNTVTYSLLTVANNTYHLIYMHRIISVLAMLMLLFNVLSILHFMSSELSIKDNHRDYTYSNFFISVFEITGFSIIMSVISFYLFVYIKHQVLGVIRYVAYPDDLIWFIPSLVLVAFIGLTASTMLFNNRKYRLVVNYVFASIGFGLLLGYHIIINLTYTYIDLMGLFGLILMIVAIMEIVFNHISFNKKHMERVERKNKKKLFDEAYKNLLYAKEQLDKGIISQEDYDYYKNKHINNL